jgi:hypothetical protein
MAFADGLTIDAPAIVPLIICYLTRSAVNHQNPTIEAESCLEKPPDTLLEIAPPFPYAVESPGS